MLLFTKKTQKEKALQHEKKYEIHLAQREYERSYNVENAQFEGLHA